MQVRHHRLDDHTVAHDRGTRRAAGARRGDFAGSRNTLDEVRLGRILGSERFFLTAIFASAGLYLVTWIGFLWMLTWLIPSVL